jgi:hypothetical protein
VVFVGGGVLEALGEPVSLVLNKAVKEAVEVGVCTAGVEDTPLEGFGLPVDVAEPDAEAVELGEGDRLPNAETVEVLQAVPVEVGVPSTAERVGGALGVAVVLRKADAVGVSLPEAEAEEEELGVRPDEALLIALLLALPLSEPIGLVVAEALADREREVDMRGEKETMLSLLLDTRGVRETRGDFEEERQIVLLGESKGVEVVEGGREADTLAEGRGDSVVGVPDGSIVSETVRDVAALGVVEKLRFVGKELDVPVGEVVGQAVELAEEVPEGVDERLTAATVGVAQGEAEAEKVVPSMPLAEGKGVRVIPEEALAVAVTDTVLVRVGEGVWEAEPEFVAD